MCNKCMHKYMQLTVKQLLVNSCYSITPSQALPSRPISRVLLLTVRQLSMRRARVTITRRQPREHYKWPSPVSRQRICCCCCYCCFQFALAPQLPCKSRAATKQLAHIFYKPALTNMSCQM